MTGATHNALPSDALEILLLCSGASVHIGTVLDHIDAFFSRSRHNVTPADATYCAESGMDTATFDVIVFHYSVVISDPNHIRPELAARIKAFDGLKVAFIQDEYRWIDRQNAALEDLGVTVLYTVTNPEVTRHIYRTPYFDRVRIEHTLTGFVPEHLLSVATPAYSDRPIDVSYRARRAPAWYGAFAEEKFTIGERFAAEARAHDLCCDIEWAESRRIYGEDWVRFVSSSKATLGTESGVSFIDFTGDVQARAEAYEAAHPDAPPAQIREMFLGDSDGHITIQVISPRVFEAAALRTLLVLYPGNYSGVLTPWRHYVPLAKDHSNMAEVVSVIASPEKAMPIVERAYREVACNPSWWLGSLVTSFDSVVEEEVRKTSRSRSASALRRGRIAADLSRQWRTQTSWNELTSLLTGYRTAHDEVAGLYGVLASEYQKLAAAHTDLVGHYQSLASAHERLTIDHQMLNADYNAYKLVGPKEHLRRAATLWLEHNGLRQRARDA